jgi:hypothetical protein
MATKIRLKKSGLTGNVPNSTELEYGELAINYADGVLYYKDSSNNIQQISGAVSNTFETINANGTLLIPDSNTDILSILAGDGIDITGNGISDTLTISVRLNDTINSNSNLEAATANAVKTAYDLANTANTTASLAYDAANNAAVKVTANSGTAFSANTLSFNNTATVSVTVTQDGANANISFDAAPQVIVDDTFFGANDVTSAATANIANGLYLLVTDAANTVRVSQNGTSTLSSKQLNFINTESVTITVSDSGDGNANISFASIGAANGAINSDLFTGTGACTEFALSQTSNTERTFVFVNGVAQKPVNDYSVVGSVLNLNFAPANGTIIEARTIEAIDLVEVVKSRFELDVFNGNGVTTQFTLPYPSATTKTLVYIDGVSQVPLTDFNVNGSTLTFTNPPLSNTVIEVRSISNFFVSAGNVATIKSNTHIASGACTEFLLSSNSTTLGTFVFVDGVVQVPTVDYTVANNLITFTNPPEANGVIELRSFSDLQYYSGNGNNIVKNDTVFEVLDDGIKLSAAGFSTREDSVSRTYILRGTTTSNAEIELKSVNLSRIDVPANTTIFYSADIVARRTDATGESAGFAIKGVVDNFSGTVADVGNLYELVVAEDDANVSVDARADDTNNTINIYATGVNGKTIRWTALVKTIEVAQ